VYAFSNLKYDKKYGTVVGKVNTFGNESMINIDDGFQRKAIVLMIE